MLPPRRPLARPIHTHFREGNFTFLLSRGQGPDPQLEEDCSERQHKQPLGFHCETLSSALRILWYRNRFPPQKKHIREVPTVSGGLGPNQFILMQKVLLCDRTQWLDTGSGREMAVCEGCFTVGSCVEARQLLLILSLGFLLVKTGLVTSSFVLPLLWGKQEMSLAEDRAQCLASDRYSVKTSLSSVAVKCWRAGVRPFLFRHTVVLYASCFSYITVITGKWLILPETWEA